MAEAQEAEESKQYEYAQEYYQNALKHKPGDAAAQQALAALPQKIAERDYRKALTEGQSEEQSKRWEAAKKLYVKALDIQREGKEAQERLAYVLAQIAEREYQSSMADARKAEAGEDFAKALSHYENALKHKPSDTGAQQALAALPQKNAEKQYQACMAKAKEAELSQDYEEAEKQYTASLQHKKAGEQAAVGVQQCRQIIEQAESCLTQSKTLFQARKYQSALVQVWEGLRVRPQHAELLQAQKVCKEAVAQQNGAIETVAQFVKQRQLATAAERCELATVNYPESQEATQLLQKIKGKQKFRRRARQIGVTVLILATIGAVLFWQFQNWQAYQRRQADFAQAYGEAEKAATAKEWAKAIAAYEQAKASDFEDKPEDVDNKLASARYNQRKDRFLAHYNAAETAARAQKWEEAFANYEQAKASEFADKPKDVGSKQQECVYRLSIEQLSKAVASKDWLKAREVFWKISQSKGETPELQGLHKQIPQVALKFSLPKKIVQGLVVQFAVEAESKLYRVVWDFGDGQQQEAAQASHAYLKAGDMQVKLTVSDGVYVTERKKNCLVEANKPPEVVLEDPVSVKEGEPASFKATAKDPEGQPLTYLWYLGDGKTAKGPAVECTYDAAGEKEITLVVNDGVQETVKTAKVTCVRYWGSGGVILDAQTDLEWYVGPDQDTTWDQAKKWTDTLTVDGGGWRMPTIEQLRGLYQKAKGSRNMDPIFATTGWYVWSSEADSSSARGFNVTDGSDKSIYRSYSGNLRSFLVRARRRG